MSRLELLIPPPVILLLAMGLAYLLSGQSWQELFIDVSFDNIFWPLLFISAGATVAISGVLEFIKFKTTVDPLHPNKSKTIVQSGVYAFTRNPMYLGMLLVLLGWADFLDSLNAFSGAVFFFLYIDRFQIRPEEAILSANFGEEYLNYLRQVRRWL